MIQLSKPSNSSSHLCWMMLFIIMLFPFVAVLPMHQPILDMLRSSGVVHDDVTPLTVITLIYGQPDGHRYIAHNCRMISSTKHRFIVYTDDTSQSYCGLCECRLYVEDKCRCPQKGADGCRTKNPCKKLFFLIGILRKFKEVVFLDNDLIIMKDFFLDRLQIRSRAHDFLASYGHAGIQSTKYLKDFNSGLMFIRWLPTANYDALKEIMYKHGSERDQGHISRYIQKNYANWDVLSWKWHCRQLKLMKQDIPPSDCYTLHDRGEGPYILKKLNLSLLTVT